MAADGRPLTVTVVGLNYLPEPTGIAPYTAGLAESLRAAGDQVNVITGYPHYPRWKRQAGYDGVTIREHINSVAVKRVRHPIPRAPAPVNRLVMEFTFGIRSVLSGWGRADIALLVSPALFSTGVALLRARLTGVPTCIWVQDIYSLGVEQTGAASGRSARVIRTLERRILRSASSILVIHDRFKRYLVTELGVEEDRVLTVRNWSHVLPHDAQSTRDAVRERHGWATEDVVVLHAGNMGAKQGLENVVDASEIADRQGSLVRFVLLGDGNRRPTLERRAANDRLDFLDPLPDGEFEETLAAADILLVNERPGLTEMSVPSKLTTYFATGLPVIAATDESSITAEELASAGAGPRVDAADPAALVQAAERLGGDADAAAAHGRAGRAFAEANLAAGPATNRIREHLSALARRRRA